MTKGVKCKEIKRLVYNNNYYLFIGSNMLNYMSRLDDLLTLVRA